MPSVKKAKKKVSKKVPGDTLSDLKKVFDSVFSMYIRQRDKGVCFTCGDTKWWKYQQNGHYVSRTYMSLRYDEKNCNCQCMGCNIFRHGNMDEYAVRLTRKYGPKVLEDLNKQKNTIRKWTVVEMKEAIKLYEKKILDLNKR